MLSLLPTLTLMQLEVCSVVQPSQFLCIPVIHPLVKWLDHLSKISPDVYPTKLLSLRQFCLCCLGQQTHHPYGLVLSKKDDMFYGAGLDCLRDWTNNVQPSIPIYVAQRDFEVGTSRSELCYTLFFSTIRASENMMEYTKNPHAK